jgi:hypothetical protein
MNKAFSFEFEQDEENLFDPELADSEWEEEVQQGRPSAAARPSSTPCPPFEFACDMNCPFLFLECPRRREELCHRILGAIILAKNAGSELETKPLRPGTVKKFRQIFGQSPFDHWEIPGTPRRTALAGDIVASRFRTVEKELRTRNTLYRCDCKNGGSSGGKEPSHPTETIVRDLNAWAVLCRNEVRLCPPFWTQSQIGQEGTILHEMFHLCFGLTCAWFQHDRKERKRNNAYCYEAFAVGPAAEPITISKCDGSQK